jgi:hypothetical protein
MASTSENTFGTKINNAEKLIGHLKSFTGYVPLNPLDSITEIETRIIATKTANNTAANKLQSYTLSVDVRQKLLKSDSDSLQKLATPIIAYVRAAYGKKSKEASSINEQITSIRGSKPSKPKLGDDEKNISTSQQSYASLTQAFADLIASLQVLSPAYNPPNEAIKLTKLLEKYTAIEQANAQVNSVLGELTKARKERDDLYDVVKESCARVKEAVKSQYGNGSTEYKLIKGLAI